MYPEEICKPMREELTNAGFLTYQNETLVELENHALFGDPAVMLNTPTTGWWNADFHFHYYAFDNEDEHIPLYCHAGSMEKEVNHQGCGWFDGQARDGVRPVAGERGLARGAQLRRARGLRVFHGGGALRRARGGARAGKDRALRAHRADDRGEPVLLCRNDRRARF